MAEIKCISPPPKCFSCGRILPEGDFAEFHLSKNSYKFLDEKKYVSPCCRRMFLGDNLEFRQMMALYDMTTINDTPKL